MRILATRFMHNLNVERIFFIHTLADPYSNDYCIIYTVCKCAIYSENGGLLIISTSAVQQLWTALKRQCNSLIDLKLAA